MGCCPSIGQGLTNFVLSTNTNYESTRQSAVGQVKGTGATLGVVLPSMTGSATLTVSFWQSFDGGLSFITTGTPIQLAAQGVATGGFTGLTAGLYMIKAVVTGTNVTVMGSVVVNFYSA